MNTRWLDGVWAILIAATVLTWQVGERGAGGLAVVLGLIGISAVKGGLVILDFMALRQVKFFWRALVLGWLLLVLAIIALAYWSGAR